MFKLMNKKQLTIFSLIVTIGLAIWSFALLLWNSDKWFINKSVHYAWFTFDMFLITFFLLITYFVWKESKHAHFLAPFILGMIIADWILNVGLWIYGGYNLLELRFIFSFAFIIVSTLFFGYFFNEIYKDSKEWK